MTTRKPKPEPEPEPQDADVDLEEVDIDLDAKPAKEQKPPAKVRIGGRTFLVPWPDAGLIMEIEESQRTATTLSLLFDDQWPDVRPLISEMDPEVLITLVQQLGDKFGFSQQAILERAAPNRAARRQRDRVPR